MNERQILKITAYERISELRRLNQGLVQAKPKVVAGFDKLEAKASEIRNLDAKILTGSGGAKGNYKTARTNLVNCTITVQGPLVAFASDTSNHAVTEAAGFPETFYARAGQDVLYNRASVVYTTALPFEAVLVADYSLGQNDLAGLEEALNQYHAALPAKNQATKGTKTDHARLGELFSEAGKLLAALNKQMLVFRMTAPEFYSAFMESKKIGGYSKKKAPDTIVP